MSVVSETMMKSSAVSVWILPRLDGRERVAIFPSGWPVENEKEAAEAWEASRSKASTPPAVFVAENAANTNRGARRRGDVSVIMFILFRSFTDSICVIIGKKVSVFREELLLPAL